MLNSDHRCIGERCVRAFATHGPSGTGSTMDTAQQLFLPLPPACSHLSLLCLEQCLQREGEEETSVTNAADRAG